MSKSVETAYRQQGRKIDQTLTWPVRPKKSPPYQIWFDWDAQPFSQKKKQ